MPFSGSKNSAVNNPARRELGLYTRRMSTLTPLIEAWDEGHREFAFAFDGLSDEDLWKRPHPTLLSVGELGGHVAYWQAGWPMGGGEARSDLSQLPIQSPLVYNAFRYYTLSVAETYSLPMGTKAVLDEVMRVHAEA